MPGEIIVREGEPGEEFFLVADGAVHVLGRGFDGTDLVLARLEAGSCFGEQALLEDRPVPRSASVRSATRCRLLVLPRHALGQALDKDEQVLALLRRTGETQKAERSTLFRERILSELGIGAGYAIEHFAAGSYVFHEGDPGDKIYLIVKGRALVLKGAGNTARCGTASRAVLRGAGDPRRRPADGFESRPRSHWKLLPWRARGSVRRSTGTHACARSWPRCAPCMSCRRAASSRCRAVASPHIRA